MNNTTGTIELINDELNKFQQILKQDILDLKQDVFHYLQQSRLQSFRQCCPYLNSPIPYKIMVSLSLGHMHTTPISFSINDAIESFDSNNKLIMLHPMMHGQILPCVIDNQLVSENKINLLLRHKAGFFYLENDYIDIWVTDKDEVTSRYLYTLLDNATFQLEIEFDDKTISKDIQPELLHYSYVHPNEKMKDEIRDSRFYQGLKLKFENDFPQFEIKQAQLIITIKEDIKHINELSSAITINYVPLINYQVSYAMPISLDGTKDSYPLLSEVDDDLSLLKILSVKVRMEDSKDMFDVYPHIASQCSELSYDLIRPTKDRKVKNAHLMLFNICFGRHLSLQVNAAWYDSAAIVGSLSNFNFISKPVEEIKIEALHYLEACNEIELDMNMMYSVQNLVYKPRLIMMDFMALLNALAPEKHVREKLERLIHYFYKCPDTVYDTDKESVLSLSENIFHNKYLNEVFKILLNYHQSMVKR